MGQNTVIWWCVWVSTFIPSHGPSLRRTQKIFPNTSVEEVRPETLGNAAFRRFWQHPWFQGPGDHHLHWREEWSFKLVSWQPIELTTSHLTSLWISTKTYQFHWGFESITMVVGLLLAFITWVLLVFYEWALCALLVFRGASPQATRSYWCW